MSKRRGLGLVPSLAMICLPLVAACSGSDSTGGAVATGGAVSPGGAKATGGTSSATGGIAATGGSKATGGTTAMGGTIAATSAFTNLTPSSISRDADGTLHLNGFRVYTPSTAGAHF